MRPVLTLVPTPNAPDQHPQRVPMEHEITEIIEYLNQRTGKRFKPRARETRRLLKVRFAEGFNVEELKQVIDNKVAEWQGNPDMERYLRPETLFNGKADRYLNETPPARERTQREVRPRRLS